MTNIGKKFRDVYSFLVNNRQYNHSLQGRYYHSIISPYNNTPDKVASLLYHIANTQSRPKIDNLAIFYKHIFEDSNCLNSMKSFIAKTNVGNLTSFKSLFDGMKNQKGWGEKTSALFTKCIYHLHNGGYSKKFKFWNDVPQYNEEIDDLYLPVDIVITMIFNKIDNSTSWNFDNINAFLKYKYKGQQIEVWDDLWFWGFITQKGSGNKRIFEWNEYKYWALKESDKNPAVIKDIKRKAKTFLRIISNNE